MNETKSLEESRLIVIVFSVSHQYENEQEDTSIRDVIAFYARALTTAVQSPLLPNLGCNPSIDDNSISCRSTFADSRLPDGKVSYSIEGISRNSIEYDPSVCSHYSQYHCDVSNLVLNDADAHFAGCLAKVLRSSPAFVSRYLRYLWYLNHRRRIGRSKVKTKSKADKNLPGTSLKSETEILSSPLYRLNSSAAEALNHISTTERMENHVQSDECRHRNWNHPLFGKSKRHCCSRAAGIRERLCGYLDEMLIHTTRVQKSEAGELGNSTVSELETTGADAITKYRVVLVSLHSAMSLWLDLAWWYRVEKLVIKTAMLDDALNWLSTLGGAYSALGDHFQHHAVNAQRISYTQLRVALEMDCEPVISRCYLYIALSEMQQGRLCSARRIIKHQFVRAKGMTVVDTRLLAMCRGMWSRLRYLYSQSRGSTQKPLSSTDVTNGHSVYSVTDGYI